MARDKKPPLLAGVRKELGGLSAELAEMVRCHTELARLEIMADVRNLQHLAIAMAISGVLALTCLPLAAARTSVG